MPPRWRLPLLALGLVSLAFGLAGGLARLSPGLNVPPAAVALHGALMVSAFFGTVIALERAAALDRLWGYAAPLAAALGGVLILAGHSLAGFVLQVAAAALLVGLTAIFYRRQPGLEMGALLAGAAAWLGGNAALLAGHAAVPWWIAFFALTIGGERLELTRYLKRGIFSRNAFLVIAIAVFFLSTQPMLQGAALVLLALWLLAFDLARVTIRQERLPRYVAACLLAGYFWLALGGLGLLMELPPDMTLHAIFVGFVFSMVLGHAPVILPAVLRIRFPYHPVLYLPLALLHVSLAVRVLVSAPAGAWGNVAAIVVFIVTSIVIVKTFDRRQSKSEAAR